MKRIIISVLIALSLLVIACETDDDKVDEIIYVTEYSVEGDVIHKVVIWYTDEFYNRRKLTTHTDWYLIINKSNAMHRVNLFVSNPNFYNTAITYLSIIKYTTVKGNIIEDSFREITIEFAGATKRSIFL